jgi:two-component system sensor histidine kinase AtoS/two-component system sensor histidine kinase FlrB
LAGISAIESQLGYINKIVSDLQDFARPLTPELTKINLRALIEDSILSVVIPSNIVVSIDVDSKLDLLLDLTFMRRIITNLLTNAIQAMPQGGKLTIKTFIKTITCT